MVLFLSINSSHPYRCGFALISWNQSSTKLVSMNKAVYSNARKTLAFPSLLGGDPGIAFFFFFKGLNRSYRCTVVRRIKDLVQLLSSCQFNSLFSRVRAFILFQIQPKAKGLSIFKPRIFHYLWKFVYTLIYTSGHHKFPCIYMSKVSILSICVSLRDKKKLRIRTETALITE